MGHWHDVQAGLRGPARDLRDKIPEVYKGFVQMDASSLADGALSGKVKQLIALAIGVAERCDGCIAAHARGAVRQGATPEEVAETLGVTLMMGGGPSTVYAPRAWEAYQEFLAEKT
ncbi:MAG TPA: carboxymuconolactone decarboxylase family protein [Acidimicrobiia bacterium]|jgi:AhpD family alkylhydroperoxidase